MEIQKTILVQRATDVFRAYSVSTGKNITCAVHAHLAMEIVVVTRGILKMEIACNIFRVSEREAVYIAPLETHAFLSDAENECLILEFPTALVPGMTAFLSENIFTERQIRLLPGEYAYLIEALRYADGDTPLFPLSVLAPLCAAARGRCRFRHADTETDRLIGKALKCIHSSSSSTVTLASVAAELGIHPSTLSRMFSAAVGMRFHRYLITVRCFSAVAELCETERTVTDIAMSSGFETVRSFNNCIKRIYGMTPTDIRKNKTSFFFGLQTPSDG